MTAYDYDRPFIAHAKLQTYIAIEPSEAKKYGGTVKATELSNIEYKTRFAHLARENNMKAPPSCGRIFMGYLVVRKMGSSEQYETWMPDHVFEEIYREALDTVPRSGQEK